MVSFRATARTLLDELLGFRPDIIEHQLAHAVKDPNGRAYNRTTHLVERTRMMQEWADYLDRLRMGSVVPLRHVGALDVRAWDGAAQINHTRRRQCGGGLYSGGGAPYLPRARHAPQ